MRIIPVRHIFVLGLMSLLTGMLCACEEKKQQVMPAPQVRFMRLIGEKITMTWELPGRVSAFTVSEVRPQVNGIIKSRLFEEGADVLAGQELYVIEPELYQAAYNNAKANLAKAEANAANAQVRAERYSVLVRSKSISVQDYDDAVAAAKHANATVVSASEMLESARISLGYTKVTAPVSGRIGRSFVTSGALVTQSQSTPLATIQQISPVYVDVTLPSVELIKLRRAIARGDIIAGEKESVIVRLTLEEGSPYTRLTSLNKDEEPDWLKGALLFSDITVEQSTGVVVIRVRFDNPENVLLPGMYVRALLDGGVKGDSIMVPQRAVARDARGLPIVYVLSKESPPQQSSSQKQEHRTLAGGEYYVHAREVTLGRDYGNRWLIDSGLKAGELLLVDGLQKVRPGQLVQGIAIAPATVSGNIPQVAQANGQEGRQSW